MKLYPSINGNAGHISARPRETCRKPPDDGVPYDRDYWNALCRCLEGEGHGTGGGQDCLWIFAYNRSGQLRIAVHMAASRIAINDQILPFDKAQTRKLIEKCPINWVRPEILYRAGRCHNRDPSLF